MRSSKAGSEYLYGKSLTNDLLSGHLSIRTVPLHRLIHIYQQLADSIYLPRRPTIDMRPYCMVCLK